MKLRDAAYFALFAAGLAWLAGCAGSIRSDVVSFHANPLPRGETIRVVAADPKLRQTIEFEHYAALIRARLQKIGYTPVTGESPAELMAEVEYAVADSNTVVRSTPGGFSHYYFHYGHYHDPFYYGLSSDWEPETYSYVVYHRELRLTIQRTEAPQQHLFEGRVHSVGRESEISKVMPYLITALFANFPGESGVTKVVTIERDE